MVPYFILTHRYIALGSSGAVRCSAVWCGAVRCGVVWGVGCGVWGWCAWREGGESELNWGGRWEVGGCMVWCTATLTSSGDYFSRIAPLHTTPHAPSDVPYYVPIFGKPLTGACTSDVHGGFAASSRRRGLVPDLLHARLHRHHAVCPRRVRQLRRCLDPGFALLLTRCS